MTTASPTAARPSAFERLPTELHIQISSSLDPRTVIRLSQTCRLFSRVYGDLVFPSLIDFVGNYIDYSPGPDSNDETPVLPSFYPDLEKRFKMRLFFINLCIKAPFETLQRFIDLWPESDGNKKILGFAARLLGEFIFQYGYAVCNEAKIRAIIAAGLVTSDPPEAPLKIHPPQPFSAPAFSSDEDLKKWSAEGPVNRYIALIVLFSRTLGPSLDFVNRLDLWTEIECPRLARYLFRQSNADPQAFVSAWGGKMLHYYAQRRSNRMVAYLLSLGVDPDCWWEVTTWDEISKVQAKDYVFQLVSDENYYLTMDTTHWSIVWRKDMSLLRNLIWYGAEVDFEELEEKLSRFCEEAFFENDMWGEPGEIYCDDDRLVAHSVCIEWYLEDARQKLKEFRSWRDG